MKGEHHLEELLYRLGEYTKVWTEFMCYRTDLCVTGQSYVLKDRFMCYRTDLCVTGQIYVLQE